MADNTKIVHSLLLRAIVNEDIETIKSLIKTGIDINNNTLFDKTALMYAVEGKNINIVKLLLTAGADANINSLGLSPIHIAMENYDIDIIRLLIRHGAILRNDCIAVFIMNYGCSRDPNFANDNEKMTNIVKLLLLAGYSPNTSTETSSGHFIAPLFMSLSEGCVEIAKLLIKTGADVNKCTDIGTPLSSAIYMLNPEKIEIVKLLIDAGADVNGSYCDWKNNEGNRSNGDNNEGNNGGNNEVVKTKQLPLFIAAKLEETIIVKLLIKSGAKFDIPNEYGKTVIDYAYDGYFIPEINDLLIREYAHQRRFPITSMSEYHGKISLNRINNNGRYGVEETKNNNTGGAGGAGGAGGRRRKSIYKKYKKHTKHTKKHKRKYI